MWNHLLNLTTREERRFLLFLAVALLMVGLIVAAPLAVDFVRERSPVYHWEQAMLHRAAERREATQAEFHETRARELEGLWQFCVVPADPTEQPR